MTPTIDTLPATPDIAPLPTVDGGFQTVLAGPPWRFANRTGRSRPEHDASTATGRWTWRRSKMPSVGDVTAKDAHLYLWVPNAAPRRDRGPPGVGLPLRLQRHLGQAPQGRGPTAAVWGLLLPQRHRADPVRRQGIDAHTGAGALDGQHDRDPQARALPQAR